MSDSSTAERCGQEANGTNGAAAKPRRPKEPTKAELRARLEEALARAELAEAEVGGPVVLRAGKRLPPADMLAPAEGVLRLWWASEREMYRVSLLGMSPPKWMMTKFTDGTRYELEERDGLIYCNCPGGKEHGPRCNGDRGCKHARAIRAIRQVVDPGV